MEPVYILYGTESGNAEGLAERTGDRLKGESIPVVVRDMQDFEPADVAKLRTLLVITSTFGNGDPPFNAEAFHTFLKNDCGDLSGLSFSVLALGDTTYDYFAQCGKDFDAFLEAKGAKRFAPRVDCDVDYEEPYEEWLSKMLPALKALSNAAASAPAAAKPALQAAPISSTGGVAAPGTKRNPIAAKVVANVNLNGDGSTKETRHIVLSLGEMGVGYQLGDSFGLFPQNDPELVAAVLQAAGLDGATPVQLSGRTMALRDALWTALDIVTVDPRLLELVGGPTDAKARQQIASSHHVIDVLRSRSNKGALDVSRFVGSLRHLAPRLYSVASSPAAHPGEVYLLVDVIRYQLHGTNRTGVFSGQATARSPEGSVIPAYVHPAPHFRLCANDRPIIMIGPGTGVAPFRGFVEQRAVSGAQGKSWLFYGARNAATDFIYGPELTAWRDQGVLTRLDCAFSRDQAQKVYVQHLMASHGAELYRWIKDGAVIYVCGDAKQMAPDVHRTLVDIMAREGRQTPEQAAAQLSAMAERGDYQRDVY